jgi:hypothetical protein
MHDKERSVDWFARIGLLITFIGLLINFAALYFSNFYKPEDLSLAARVSQRDQIGTDRLELTLVFTNRGTQPAVVEKIVLALLYGRAATIEGASDWKVEGAIWVPEHFTATPARTTKMQDGTLLSVYDGSKVTLNNQSMPTTSALIAAGNVALMDLTFETAPINLSDDGPIVPSVAIRFYDKYGVTKDRVIPLGIMSSPSIGGRLYNPTSGLAKLLPFH